MAFAGPLRSLWLLYSAAVRQPPQLACGKPQVWCSEQLLYQMVFGYMVVRALDLVRLAVHGPRNAVDKVLKGARMHT